MKSTLDKIIAYKKEELASLLRRVTLKDVQLKAQDREPAKPFLMGFKKGKINIIAEIKKASPSGGVLCNDFRPVDLAKKLEENGASALSVLTDSKFFRGSIGVLTQVKEKAALPCLRKDFTLDLYHIYEARGAGADAVLLIAAILDPVQLKDFNDLAGELGMVSLVEVHNEKELQKVLPISPKLIGINNRDLHYLKTDIQTSLRLIQKVPDGITRISESGLRDHTDLVGLQKAGFDGFLIGEALMRERDVGKKLRELISG